jgi:hypothetical protein
MAYDFEFAGYLRLIFIITQRYNFVMFGLFFRLVKLEVKSGISVQNFVWRHRHSKSPRDKHIVESLLSLSSIAFKGIGTRQQV